MQDELCTLAGARTGHFVLASGYHCDRWFDLDRLFLPGQRARLQPFVAELARRLAAHPIEAVCGPATGGALLAERLGLALRLPYFFSRRFAPPPQHALGHAVFHLDETARDALRGRRVALVDDAISVGSAVRGTFAALRACGAQPVVLGALLVFGGHAARFAVDHRLLLERLADLPLGLWLPADCPLCQAGPPQSPLS